MATSSKSTQDFVSIKEIRDGIVILKTGNYRAILMASSINFSLKSDDERTALLLQYQNFLNSLDFSIQIHLESRKLDIEPYLASLEAITKDQNNELLKIQSREYITFIRTFTESTNIMSKNFFIVVPYDPPVVNNSSNFASKIPFLSKRGSPEQNVKNFEAGKLQLQQRLAVVAEGLGRLGVKSAQLDTDELIELYFKLFNPGERGVPTSVNN